MDQRLDKQINAEIDKIGLEKLLKELTVASIYWFRHYGLNPERGIHGSLPEDIAIDAIEKVIKQEKKWKPQKTDLKFHLKNNVIKELVKNLANKKETKVSDNADVNDLPTSSESSSLDLKMDTETLQGLLEKEFENDEAATNILYGKMDGMKRREIIDEFGMKPTDYDNAMKRYKTVIKRLSKSNEAIKSLKNEARR